MERESPKNSEGGERGASFTGAGQGNDQVRFELAIKSRFFPDML